MKTIVNPFYRDISKGRRKEFVGQVNLFDRALVNFNHNSAEDILVEGEIVYLSIRSITVAIKENDVGIKPMHYSIAWRNVKEVYKDDTLQQM